VRHDVAHIPHLLVVCIELQDPAPQHGKCARQDTVREVPQREGLLANGLVERAVDVYDELEGVAVPMVKGG
jgi:hypothetical protein